MAAPFVRLFADMNLEIGSPASLPKEHAHYLGNVMRLVAGDEVKLFNGAQGEFLARMVTLSKQAVLLQILAQTRKPEPAPDSWLCFALLKRQKTELVAEKATELGVSVIQPVVTARTQTSTVNADRLRAIATEAAEQCERLDVPDIRAPITLPKLLAGWPTGRALYLADERRTAQPLGFSAAPSALLIGPEGGFTEAEVAATQAHPAVTRVSLGTRILRAETAAIAGLALLLASGPPQE